MFWEEMVRLSVVDNVVAPSFLKIGARPCLPRRRSCVSPSLPLRLFVLHLSTRRPPRLFSPSRALFGTHLPEMCCQEWSPEKGETHHPDGRELKCCYKASIDGFSATVFHRRWDFKGPCVIVGVTEKGVRFGAFSPEGYRSTDDYYDSVEPFLFYWEEDGRAPVVLRKVGGSGAALFDYACGGPQFGAHGLHIGPPLAPVMGGFSGPDTNSGVRILTQGKSRLGLSYAKRLDGKDSISGNDRYATISELEVFCSPAMAKLY